MPTPCVQTQCVCVCTRAVLGEITTRALLCVGELERPPKDDCQLQREANPSTFILTGKYRTPLTLTHILTCTASHNS